MTGDHQNASPQVNQDLTRRTLATVVVALVALAWAIYRPDKSRPFHMTDFSEFVSLLESQDGVIGRMRAVVDYYATQGRFNVIPYAWIAFKWTLMGWWSPGWQVLRAVLMLTLFGLSFLLLRRLGASRLGGLIGASVFLFAPSASDGWVHLTMAEPLGAAITLAMSLLATRYQASARWQRDALLMAVGAAALILTKELLAPLMFLPIVLALTLQPDGMFAWPARNRRNAVLVLSVAVASLLAIVPVAWLYLRGGESAYASMYGRATQSIGGIFANWIAALIPFEAAAFPASVPWALSVFAFFGLVATGWRIAFHSGGDARRARWLLSIAFLVPLVGILAYIPNPWYARFYSLPLLTGTALLIGMGASYVHRVAPHGAALATLAWAVMTVFPAGSAWGFGSSRDAEQRRNDRLVSFVADSIDADSVHFAVTRPPPYAWLGLGATMNRFAAATGRPWPLTRDIGCEQARAELESRPALVIVNLVSSCELQAPERRVVSEAYKRVDWPRLRVVSDSSHADIFPPTPNHRSP